METSYKPIFDEAKRKAARDSIVHDAHDYLTICEQIRFMYDIVYQIESKEVKELLTEHLTDAFIMGKKMVERLDYYKRHYQDKKGHRGSNIKHLEDTRARRRLRRGRAI